MTWLVVGVLAIYLSWFAFQPKRKIFRPVRFVLAYFCVLFGGTFALLDPEGRSERVGPLKAFKYAWQVSG